jgi:hypothetical protein
MGQCLLEDTLFAQDPAWIGIFGMGGGFALRDPSLALDDCQRIAEFVRKHPLSATR